MQVTATLPRVSATRYVTPLREGGSLPGLIEASDDGIYVCKFRGAGQGLRVLVAEVIVAELARRIGLRTPSLVVMDLDPAIARYEADQEVQDLLNASIGHNLGVDFLPGSFGYDAAAKIDPELAARILWFDAFVANVDRTWRNTNLLVWHGEVWLIDHGASLYFHHGWTSGATDPARFAVQPWDIGEHVFGAHVGLVAGVDGEMAAALSDDVIDEALALVPDEWLEHGSPDELRAGYRAFLIARRDSGRPWLPGGAA